MIDLSFISIPIIVIVNAYCFLWVFLSIVYLTRKAEVDDPLLQDHFVSVILPARDEERVIQNIIADLKAQTYKKLEIIVLAHNCKDKTYEKALETAKSVEVPVKVYKLTTSEVGKGIGLQYGLEKSKGDLIIYFDSDSVVPSIYIEGLIGWIERGYDAVQGNIVGSNPRYNRLTFLQHLENLIFMRIFWGGKHRLGLPAGLGGTGVMVKREVLDAVGGYQNVLIEDFDLFMRLNLGGFKVAYAENCFIYDEKVPSWRKLIRQRSRWMAGHFQLIKRYPIKTHLKLFLKNPIDFLQLFSPIFLLSLLIVTLLGFFRLFLPITYWETPLIIWLILTLFMNFLFAMVLKRQRIGFRQSCKYLPVLYLFCLHWYAAFVKSFFINGWSDTKTEHGLIGVPKT